ncbi:MAG: hypothetical protein A3H45_15515 [Ignavibacteria bacterium RIFCSPLOWO2_02_FULL_55_14]|nr:MAG: hypothetical protein A2X68_10635 [Ignavibacteria bacterium GWC2_56_12]OGU64902.1 MAG: hypothetical protein A3C56_11350 [Ignavibacteria bacterium RIFCSPHIGHO2_02_FULL_56_12]OGU70437.1 MAG: hypothetical protein A3H45_15515 [Ignavibacteria bacterium RIFCSPLOWO2_02_FULL_55_14]OGU72562.1 MAG: hypothetical protein A3G43_01195 [Ignavibacteria bacterium RIFCSPLOWO2_12_FULL_56_21]HAV22183.1 competence protein ComEA [Bacteroidota bacterium]
MFSRVADWLALTPTERRVMLFLTTTFVVGLGLRLFQESFASPPIFDYSASDSTFAALSAAADAEKAPDDTSAGPVNVNTASKERLMSLPGIGAATAERIIMEREERGPFRSANDLRRVRGIGAKRIEQLRPLVTVD